MPSPITDIFNCLTPDDRALLMAAFNDCVEARVAIGDGTQLCVFLGNRNGIKVLAECGHWSHIQGV